MAKWQKTKIVLMMRARLREQETSQANIASKFKGCLPITFFADHSTEECFTASQELIHPVHLTTKKPPFIVNLAPASYQVLLQK